MFIVNKLLCKRKREESTQQLKKQKKVFRLPSAQRKVLNSINAEYNHIKIEDYVKELPLSIWYLFKLKFPEDCQYCSIDHNAEEIDFRHIKKELIPVTGYEIIGETKDAFILVKTEEIGENLNFDFPIYIYKNSKLSSPIKFIDFLETIDCVSPNEKEEEEEDDDEEDSDSDEEEETNQENQ